MSGSQEQAQLLQRIQILSQQARALQTRLFSLRARQRELQNAISELEKAENRGEKAVYQFVGANIIIEKDIKEVKQKLKDELEIVNLQISSVEKQLNATMKTLKELSEKAGIKLQ